jgi:predicted Ser/Thr protein kinase
LIIIYGHTKIKELGSGGNGTAYLVDYNGTNMVYKLEKMDVYDENTPLQSEYYRQIDFNDNIAKYHPDKFLILKAH